MPVAADISTALHLLEHINDRVKDSNDVKLQANTNEDIQSLISLLEDPVLRSIAQIQDSLTDLNTQLSRHPSILPGDFDINLSGQLELSVPNTPIQPLEISMYQDLYVDNSELDDQRVPVAPLGHTSSEDTTSAQVTSPSIVSEVTGIPPITTPTYIKEFQRAIDTARKGRQIRTIRLYKPQRTCLGFSIVGLHDRDKGEKGVFVQEIQADGIAGRDGRLLVGDEILAIDGQPLDSNISHEQAVSILQKARGTVELVVARTVQDIKRTSELDETSETTQSTIAADDPTIRRESTDIDVVSSKDWSISSSVIPFSARNDSPSTPPHITVVSTLASEPFIVERSPSAISDTSKCGSDMVLNTEWAQVEVINLINDGSGLGFGIVGGKSTGVVVKTILPGGVADRDNRLQSGDHILQIGDVNLRGMGSEQVAAVLRQSGTHVRLVVARPVEPTSPDYQANGSHAPIVPTKILGDPDELDRHLLDNVPETYNLHHIGRDSIDTNDRIFIQDPDMELQTRTGLIVDVVCDPLTFGTVSASSILNTVDTSNSVTDSSDPVDLNPLPEVERFTIQLNKEPTTGIGITIAGYVCEKEDLSGIFVKSINKGGAADLSNKIQINDRIVEVNGLSLQGYTNHDAVEVLKHAGPSVFLCLERYLRGPKYEQLQQAIAASESKLPQPSSPSITSLPTYPMSTDGDVTTEIEAEGTSFTTVDSTMVFDGSHDRSPDGSEDIFTKVFSKDVTCDIAPETEFDIKAKWRRIVGPDVEILVAKLKKFTEDSGLGISLEGTVDVENGQEVRPHHYIRSILPDGPVGQNGVLRSGDELLEVNGNRLLGINHMEVVTILKELPVHVIMVCGRQYNSHNSLHTSNTTQHQAAFGTKNIHGGSLQNLIPTVDCLVKAKSDGSLASMTSDTITRSSFSKVKSRSLEPLSGLAMWSSDPHIIELTKGERGLGFSILDYQDPMNQNETVIVIRSLVPGGVAQMDGQLIPGDRLLFVNNVILKNATLDQAVQALKSAPKGIVRMGIAKPLPIPDSISHLGRNKITAGNTCSLRFTRMGYEIGRKGYFRKKRIITSDHLESTELIGNSKIHNDLGHKSESF